MTVEQLQDAALRNLADWSAGAAWTDEVSGERRLISSDTGEGWDASRILLPEVIDRLSRELGVRRTGPRRDPGTAPARRRRASGPSDGDFAALFAEFVVEQSGGSDEPIDRRVFELSDGRLVEFAATPTPA